eukprot:6460771-Ditylum_brightwellii.AAC.1
MGQNLCLPNFAGNQPGDTYYLSLLTMYLFGVMDNSKYSCQDDQHGHHMNAYTYGQNMRQPEVLITLHHVSYI